MACIRPARLSATFSRPLSAPRVPSLARTRPVTPRTKSTIRASLTPLLDLADGAQTAATQVATQAAQNTPTPGSVDAPVWVIVASALVVTVVLSASSFLLKPGTDAAEAIKKRDAGRWSPGKK